MNKPIDPLDISLLVITNKILSALSEISSADIYEINTTEFKKDGLFSNDIFGMPGSKERIKNFAYIDLYVKVLHPRIYKELVKLSSFYGKILQGKAYAVFDEKEKDFVLSTEAEGKTGFNFFIKHLPDIKFKQTNSESRKFKIEFIKKYPINEILIDKYLVLPAGLRDYSITESGKPLEHEINALYRTVLRVATSAKQFRDDTSSNDYINSVRLRVQKAINEVYEYIEELLNGKGGYIQDKWTKRTVTYGTRNVITASPKVVTDLKDKNKPRATNIEVGVLQTAKGILPATIFLLRTNFLFDIFDPESTKARLINPKTLKRELVDISEKARSSWVSDDGLENTITKLKQPEIALSEIKIDNKYLLLIEEKGDAIRVIDDIYKYPGIDKDNLRPITYIELVYLALFNHMKEHPAYVTRYPITGLGSINIVEPYLKSTIDSTRKEVYLRGASEPIIAEEYPDLTSQVYTGLGLGTIFLAPMGADFDGDKVSLSFLLEKESVDELQDYINTKKYFLSPEGELIFSVSTNVNEIVMKDFTE